MKDFFKIVLGTILGLFIFSFLSIFFFISLIGSIAGQSDATPIIPASAIMTIDLSKVAITEQTQETDLLTILQGDTEDFQTLGIHNAVRAINAAAYDPSIRFIYMKPDAVTGGMAQIEELRSALTNFRLSGKAVVSYIETPTNAGMYLASVSDKIYMTSYEGCINMFTGVSTQMIFLKDMLKRLGVDVQLIRHGKYKSAGEMFINSKPSEENLEQNQAMIDSIWQNWSATIADSRGLGIDEINSMLDNLELSTPRDFLAKGLADELMTNEQLRQKLAVLYGVETPEQIVSIPITDYALAIQPLEQETSRPKIAVVHIDGEMVDGSHYDQVAGDRFAKLLSEIRNDSSVTAAVIRVNSPGGSVLAAEKIFSEIMLLEERMPVIASFGDYAASGGYWISAGCNKIYTNKNTLTGSIGVFSLIPDFSGTLEDKLHIGLTTVSSNRHADMYGMMRPLDNTELAYMQKSVEGVYQKFIQIVSDGRKLSAAHVEDIAQGRVWTGSEAVEIGLADEIGTLEDAIDWAAAMVDCDVNESQVEIVEYPKPMTKWELILQQLEGSDQSVLANTPFQGIGEAFSNWDPSERYNIYARMPYDFIIR